MRILLLLLIFCYTQSTSLGADDVPYVHEKELKHKVECLAKNIYHEARSESLRGQLAVAHVTLNRVDSGRYSSSLCGVVYQRNQFSWTQNPPVISNVSLYKKIKVLAYDVIMGKTTDPTRGALSFHNKTVDPGWKKSPKIVIDNHIFY
jgi:spore germination cell wall hydrolase CwlJ-like protein